jgi:hypothetical protein
MPPAEFTIVAGAGSAGVGETFTVSVYCLANQDLAGAEVQVQLPPHLELMAGDLTWAGDLRVGAVQKLQAQVRRVDSGAGAVEVGLMATNGVRVAGERWFGPLKETAPASSLVGEEARAAAPGTIYVSGRFMYDEDLATPRGTYYAHVDVYDDDGISRDHICSATTDAHGYWSCSGTASDLFDNTLEAYAIVWARNSYFVSVEDGNGDEYRHQTSIYYVDERGDTLDFGPWWPPGPPSESYSWDGAWHVHRMVGYGYVTCRDAGGETPPDYTDPHYLTARWPDPDPNDSSGYASWRIHIEGPGSAEPDTWDESPILHEYAHYLMDHFATSPPHDYCNDPGEVPPCFHTFGSHETPETAYLEGWADYYPSATKQHYGMANAQIYEETTWSYDLEANWRTLEEPWDDCEGSVACILWDISDEANDDGGSNGIGDALHMSYSDIHDIFSVYDPPGTHTNPWTIHEFWDGFTGAHPSVEDEVRRIYWEHGIDKDAYPIAPYGPSPADGSSGIPWASSLDWDCTDPDGDALTYDVYFEKDDATPDVLVATGLSTSFYDPGNLDPLAHYYWEVVAEDPYGKTNTGPVWDFVTAPNSAPVLGVVMPDSSSAAAGKTSYFTTTWWDADGWEDLKHCYFHLGEDASPVGSVTLLYNRHSNKMWIRSDDGKQWLGGHAPGARAVLENGQARVLCDQSSTEGAGLVLSVSWAVEFKPGFTGRQRLGLMCRDIHGARAKGAWKGEVSIS